MMIIIVVVITIMIIIIIITTTTTSLREKGESFQPSKEVKGPNAPVLCQEQDLGGCSWEGLEQQTNHTLN